ncbi:MAG: hypothetical protein Q4B42_04370, partial [Oscillospiraceae bacterium]|nr:hypothetical protein [Oscillospiraceae bacterium]
RVIRCLSPAYGGGKTVKKPRSGTLSACLEVWKELCLRDIIVETFLRFPRRAAAFVTKSLWLLQSGASGATITIPNRYSFNSLTKFEFRG